MPDETEHNFDACPMCNAEDLYVNEEDETLYCDACGWEENDPPTIYCANCETEATYINGRGTPLCTTCKTAFEWGMVNGDTDIHYLSNVMDRVRLMPDGTYELKDETRTPMTDTTRKVEVGYAYYEGNANAWTTFYVSIPADTPDDQLWPVAEAAAIAALEDELVAGMWLHSAEAGDDPWAEDDDEFEDDDGE